MTLTPTSPTIDSYGDNAVLVHWESEGFNAEISDAVHALAASLRAKKSFIEVMPGYDSLVASFDAAQMTAASAKRRIEDTLIREARQKSGGGGRQINIPVEYGGDAGPDLVAMAKAVGLTPDEVIVRHMARDYRVCMMGFIPGFAFLSDVDPALNHPRHATPRASVPAGSIGIANWQTGIYGLESPGGWQIIGRTSLKMFDADRDPPFLVEAGDIIRFVAQ